MDSFNIAKTIRDLRVEYGYSQARLGELLSVSDSAVSKWESGDSNPNIDQIDKMAKLFGKSIDEFLDYQRQKNEERIKLEDEERARKAELNQQVKEALNQAFFCKVWDKQQGFGIESRIVTEYDGETLTLYQKEDPHIVLYDACIGSNTKLSASCYVLRSGKWEQSPVFENYTDRWYVLFDFNNPIERIRFVFDEEGIEDYEFLVKYVFADKEAYYKKIKEEEREKQSKIVGIQVAKQVFNVVIPGNFGSTNNRFFSGTVNVVFNALSDAFSYAVIELYSVNGSAQNRLKVYRLPQGEKIWMEDKIVGKLYFKLKQYDEHDILIFESDMLSLTD